ncbi:hypothetical protein SAMN04487910_0357 [Aquimarina amphilecti]|uniref:Uncharacterized protein n=1 Tax=Aquimarina amphilecti TaxID=1038014 RepID=A0A1H7GGT2_AQUAM|nr:hypothetical protein [Aquimarina amphilecti]SEK36727.1 hypothetical protein SAMN04487910_0357 [Aquimarina amphilecti]
MKKYYIFVLLISVLNLSIAQTDDTVLSNINNLVNKNDRQESISLLFQTINKDISRLTEHKELINKNLNNILKDSTFDYSVLHLSLELASNDLLIIDKESELTLIKHNKNFRSKLKQVKEYHNWIWNDESYLENRTNSGIILDVLGYCKNAVSIEELKESVNYYIDTRPKFFATISLLRRNQGVDKEIILAISKEDETRGLLYKHLKEYNKLSIFPKKHLNQKDLSRADMVNWLIYPTELARVPTNIELVKIFTIEYDDVGPADFYLWKFNADDETWKKDGYMAGLSGPFVRKESPTMDAYGYTFSAFTKFKEKSPEEHFNEIIEILDKWNNQKQ